MSIRRPGKRGDEPYYPVNNDRNNKLYTAYKRLAEQQENLIFGGRFGHYRYYDIASSHRSCLAVCEK